MQGGRSSVESLPETFEYGSSSNTSVLDQQIHWNNMSNQSETQNLPNYLVPSNDANMSYVNMAAQDGSSLSIWNTGGTSSNDCTLNQGIHDETKMEHEWTSLTINAGGPMIEERHLDEANMLSLENVNINLNNNLIDAEQSFIPLSNSNLPQGAVQGASIGGISSAVLASGLYPPVSGGLKLEHASSSSGSNPCMNSSTGVSFISEDGDDRPGSSLDGRRSACKRKTVGGFPGQSSASGANFLQHNENSLVHAVPAIHNASTHINLSSSDLLSGPSSFEEQLNPRFSTIVRGMASECYPSSSVTTNAESSHRNFRIRVNPAHQHDIAPPNLYAQGNTSRRSGVRLPHQSSSLFIPFNQSLESRQVLGSSSSLAQLHTPIIPSLPRNVHSFPWNGAQNARAGSSANYITPEERLSATRDEASSRSIPSNNLPVQPVFVPAPDIRHMDMIQDPTSWSLANGSISMAGNVPSTSRTGTTSPVHPVGPNWVQNLPTQYSRNLSEALRRSLFPSGGSDSVGQSSNFPLQHSSQPSSSQDAGHQSGPGFHNHHQQPYTRPAFLLERQNGGVLGVPMSSRSLAYAREGRSRMISEIRNALDLMRRGEGLRFEDAFIFDQSVLYGGANLHDRHRDMRLDVDNMSYEELLALEERIGNVSTGLNEETVSKCLNQHKYDPMRVDTSIEEEPCCICQEEYVEGEDIGTLGCGHDFHSACIKQWLTRKNLCPICKTTALDE